MNAVFVRRLCPRRLMTGGVIVVVALGLCGCEPLRKKFVRKKKPRKVDTEFVPVFEPETYAGLEKSLKEEYALLHSQGLVWAKEAFTNFESDYSDKKIAFSLQKFTEGLDKMSELLEGQSAQQLQGLKEEARGITDQFSESAGFRSDYNLKQRLRALERRMRRDLSADKVEEDLRRDL